jgi:hypothetical protein
VKATIDFNRPFAITPAAELDRMKGGRVYKHTAMDAGFAAPIARQVWGFPSSISIH